MSISQIIIMDKKGNQIISKQYGENPNIDYIEAFLQLKADQEQSFNQYFLIDEVNEVIYQSQYINDIIISLKDQNSFLIEHFFTSFLKILSHYIKNITEESVKFNYIIIYELLDEVVDNGQIQEMDINIINQYIKTDYKEFQNQKKVYKNQEKQQNFTGVVPWRQIGIQYNKNQFFIDIVESISQTSDIKGNLISFNINGVIQCWSQLSGMPQLQINFHNISESSDQTKHPIEEISNSVQYHNCVDLQVLKNTGQISFTPPDGPFDLLTYSLSSHYWPLFQIQLELLKQTDTFEEYMINISTSFPKQTVAQDIYINIPVAKDAIDIKTEGKSGKAEYNSAKNRIVWSLMHMPGFDKKQLRFQYKLPTIKSESRMEYLYEPIWLDFRLNYFILSGLKVKSVKIEEESGIKGTPWIRYTTQSSDFFIKR